MINLNSPANFPLLVLSGHAVSSYPEEIAFSINILQKMGTNGSVSEEFECTYLKEYLPTSAIYVGFPFSNTCHKVTRFYFNLHYSSSYFLGESLN